MVESVALADKAVFVVPFYLLAIFPIALYLNFDVINSRWRRMQHIHMWWVFYTVLFCLWSVMILYYCVEQGKRGDFKEIGASLVAILIGARGLWKLLRVRRILWAHGKLLIFVQSAYDVIRRLVPDDEQRDFSVQYHDKPFTSRIPFVSGQRRRRFEYMSSLLFDDDYPGECPARISWLRLQRYITVNDEDADQIAILLAMYMRFAIRSPKKELWTLICQTNPLVTSMPQRVSLGKMLLRLVTYGSEKSSPKDVSRNPVMTILRSSQDLNFREVGVAFFWITAEGSSEDVASALSALPLQWTRNCRQAGSQLVFETIMLFILVEKVLSTKQSTVQTPYLPTGHCSVDGELESNLMATTPSSNVPVGSAPVITAGLTSWERKFRSASGRETAARACADAVAAFLLSSDVLQEEAHGSRIELSTLCSKLFIDTFENLARDRVIAEFSMDGCLVGMAIEELIRTAELAGYVADAVFTNALDRRLGENSHGQQTMARSEIVWGLAAIVTQLEMGTNTERMKCMLRDWKIRWKVKDESADNIFAVLVGKTMTRHDLRKIPVLDGALWMLATDNSARCPEPLQAFYMHAELARHLAIWVYYSLKEWNMPLPEGTALEGSTSTVMPTLRFPDVFGRPEEFHNNWTAWKLQEQARDSESRSTYALRTNYPP